MRVASVIAASVLVCSAMASNVQRAASPHAAATSPFVGTWRLVSRTGPGRPEGSHPKGLIYYDDTGHMAAQIAPDRSRPTWPANTQPSPEQAKEAVAGYVAYFGTYSVDQGARTVTHHREAALNMYAVDLVRKYECSADGHLILTPIEKENADLRLVWERVR